MVRPTPLLFPLLSGFGIGIASAAANCTREALLASTKLYLSALEAGSLTNLTPSLSPTNFTYQENNKKADLARSPVFAQPLKIDLTRSTADVVACATYTLVISTSGGSKPFVLATQIRHPPDNNPSVITLIDTIAATTGSLFFNAKKTLDYIAKENWGVIPEGERPSRDLLKKFGDAYLDMWTDKAAADSIAWGTDCERVEGSQLTRPCGVSLPRGGSARNNGMRRYVIDETVGSVDVLCSFDALGSLPDSHEVRVENGKVKYVHTVTV